MHFQPRDLLVLVGDQGRPVKGDVADGPAEAGGVLDLVLDMGADHEQLFRHTAADHAGAAHPVFLGDHHFGAVAGRDARGAHAARTAPDDEQIDVELSHGLALGKVLPSRNWSPILRTGLQLI